MVSRPGLLVGSVVVAFVLALSRWGTNIGIGPLFISDLLIGLSLVSTLVSSSTREPFPVNRAILGRPTLLFSAFFLYFVLRFLLSLGSAPLLDWARDGVPFAYGVLAYLSGYSLARSTPAMREKTVRLFRWALTVHVIWVAFISFGGFEAGFDVLGPFGSAPAFQLRPDIEVALISVAAALYVRQVILGRHKYWNLCGIALSAAVVFLTTATRAGQFSFLLCLTFAYIVSFVGTRKVPTKQLVLALLAPIGICAVLLILPTTTAGQRLLATVAPSFAGGNAAQVNAQGTERARVLVWEGVIDWTNAEPGRALFGAGFGPDFLSSSGTDFYLEGSTFENVRSPHNWLVGVYARLGIIGAALAALWLIQLLFMIVRRLRHAADEDLSFFSATTILAIVPVAALGVILEAPFGAIPFFWASGIVMASAKRRSTADPGLPAARRREFHQDIDKGEAGGRDLRT
jgi:O-antigen ligase